MLVAAVALFAVACSGDDDDDTTPAPAAPAAATEAAPEGEPIQIGFSAWPGWFPWQVTVEAGIFDEVGVNVKMVWFEGYLDSINTFAGGQLDGNTQTLNDTIASVGAGSDQVIVLVNDNSTGNDQIIATADIQSIEDLAGKTIGIEVGVVDHFLLLLGLESVGLTAADVEIVNLETGAAAAAFASGQLDAVGVFAPFTTQALIREGSHTLFTSAMFPGAIPDHLVLSREIVDSRPEDVQKIIEAWFKTLEYIAANPADAVAIMAKARGRHGRGVRGLRRRHHDLHGCAEPHGVRGRRRLHEPAVRGRPDRPVPDRCRVHRDGAGSVGALRSVLRRDLRVGELAGLAGSD